MDKLYEIVDKTLVLRVGSFVVELDLNQVVWPFSVFSVLYLFFWKKSGFKNMNTKTLQLSDQPNSDDKLYDPKDLVRYMMV